MGFTRPSKVMAFPGTGTASVPGNSRISIIIPVRDVRVVPDHLCSGLKVYTRVRSGETEVTEVYPANGHTGHPKTVCRKAGPDVSGSKAHSASVSWIYSVHVRTRKFRNLAKTKRYIVPAPGPTQKRKAEQESTRIQSATAITLFFRVF